MSRGLCPQVATQLVDPMSHELEAIKLQLLSEYEEKGRIDIARWVAKYQSHREELLDFWLWIRDTRRLSEIDQSLPATIGDSIATDALRNACLAASLGPEWLRTASDPNDATERQLGDELAKLRKGTFSQQGRAPKTFRRAAVHSWVVIVMAESRPRVSRLPIQKATFVLEHALLLGLFSEHQRKPFGPYDHGARYRDAEPIAKEKQWIRLVSDDAFEVGEKAGEVPQYAVRYLRSEGLARRLIEVLSQLSDQELETLSTVLWIGMRLPELGQGATVQTVRAFLYSTVEWRGKLLRPNFTDAMIQAALDRLSRLRLVTLGPG